jgi:hypothetical protein
MKPTLLLQAMPSQRIAEDTALSCAVYLRCFEAIQSN